MFGQGFLLSRKTLNDVSECIPLDSFTCEKQGPCSEEQRIREILLNPSAPLVCLPNRNRVVMLLVDALRYDFTEYNITNTDPLPYQNKLPVISNILRKYPKSTRLFKFMADPPTTTLQRLKALVTGSLPTFIDASSNFAAMELQEDNSIDQLINSAGKAVLLGDDTWARLLPGRWSRSHALYSFHTWDLDTVDKEIDTKIYDELKENDWDLLVAHYLGVDHAGHRYGPNHPEMTRKLSELNFRLERILTVLPPNVILYVIGDHGMTETGDHGGESKSERTAAFFAYRRTGFHHDSSSVGNEVEQTDFAPTMSAALGRPPPSPCLGNIHLSVLPHLTTPVTLLLLTNSLKQINNYMLKYGEASQQVSIDRLTHFINETRFLLAKAAKINSEIDFQKYIVEVSTLISDIRSTFREVWVEFDSLSMLRALLLLLLAIFSNWLITDGIPLDRISNIFSSNFVPIGILCNAVAVGVCFTAYYFELLTDLVHGIILSTGLISGVVVCVLIVIQWVGICQRWHETKLQFYERFSRTTLIVSALALVSNSYVIEEGASLAFLVLSILILIVLNISTVKALSLWIGCGVVLLVSRSYRGCREEQGDCWTSKSTSGLDSREELILALTSMAVVIACTRHYVGWRGHGVVFTGLLSCSHWAVGWGSLGSPSRARLLARITWVLLASMFILLWRRDGRGPLIPVSVLNLLVYIASTMVLGVSMVPTALLAFVSGFLVIYIVSNMKNDSSAKFALSARSNTGVACVWVLLAVYHFYGTGHHATLGHVRWGPAFHAGDPNYLPIGPLVTGALVGLELFGMPLMYGTAVPLLALWSKSGMMNVGPRTQLAAVFTLSLKFCMCFAVRVFMCAFAATIHCRHLMIWGVFTPKLLFESGSCVAAFIGVILGAVLTTWHIPSPQKSS